MPIFFFGGQNLGGEKKITHKNIFFQLFFFNKAAKIRHFFKRKTNQ